MIFLGVSLLIVILIYCYFAWDLDYWKERIVPGPKPVPIFGNFFKSGTLKIHSLVEVYEIVK